MYSAVRAVVISVVAHPLPAYATLAIIAKSAACTSMVLFKPIQCLTPGRLTYSETNK